MPLIHWDIGLRQGSAVVCAQQVQGSEFTTQHPPSSCKTEKVSDCIYDSGKREGCDARQVLGTVVGTVITHQVLQFIENAKYNGRQALLTGSSNFKNSTILRALQLSVCKLNEFYGLLFGVWWSESEAQLFFIICLYWLLFRDSNKAQDDGTHL